MYRIYLDVYCEHRVDIKKKHNFINPKKNYSQWSISLYLLSDGRGKIRHVKDKNIGYFLSQEKISD